MTLDNAELEQYYDCLASFSINESPRGWCSAEQAVAAEVTLPDSRDLRVHFQQARLRRLLVLDGLQDPGNLVRQTICSLTMCSA